MRDVEKKSPKLEINHNNNEYVRQENDIREIR